MTKLYLAHSLSERKRVRELELEVEQRLKIELVNPFYDRDHPTIKSIDAGILKPYSQGSDHKKIVEGDLEGLASCDGLLAIIGNSLSIGMYMEIYHNSQILKHPTYLVIEDETVYNHPWLRYCATERFRGLAEFADWYPNKIKEEQEEVKKLKVL